jgi:hypothetical protein
MLRSIFILMLVAFMASVGFYYENQATLESGIDIKLVAATAMKPTVGQLTAPGEIVEAPGRGVWLEEDALFVCMTTEVPQDDLKAYFVFRVLDGGASMDE